MDESVNDNHNENGTKLEIGTLFETEKDAKSFFENFNKENFVDFTVAVNNKKALVYQCKFGRKRNPKCTDARPKQHYSNTLIFFIRMLFFGFSLRFY